jgi:hypothetical protein
MAIAAAGLLAIYGWAAPAAAQNVPNINIEIAQTFKWDEGSIRNVIDSADLIARKRCQNGCNIHLRIFVEGIINPSIQKKAAWLRTALEKQLNRKNMKQVSVTDMFQLI